MSDSSERDNQSSIQPDLSQKHEGKYSYRDIGATIAITIVVIIVALLLTIGLRNNYEKDLAKATADAESVKAEYKARLNEFVENGQKVIEREQELLRRERELNAREAEIDEREKTLDEVEDDLIKREEALQAEKDRIYEVLFPETTDTTDEE